MLLSHLSAHLRKPGLILGNRPAQRVQFPATSRDKEVNSQQDVLEKYNHISGHFALFGGT